MKKLLLLSEIFPPVHGGSGRWFWEVYTRLPHKQSVIAAGTSDNCEEFDHNSPLKTFRLRLASANWGIKSLEGLGFYWRNFWAVKHIIRQQNIDVLHCGRCLPEGVLAYCLKKTTGIDYLCYVHGEDIETASSSRELSWLVKKALNGATKLIANSRNSADILIDKWQVPEAKVEVIHPGVDTQVFTPAAQCAATKEKLGWQNRRVVLTVGRLQQRKGQDMMIKAMQGIVQQHPDVLYAIVGQGEQEPHLRALISELSLQDSVVIMPQLSDSEMLKCYQQCDLFILPNRTVNNDIEGFGIVLLEAQACAKAVVAGDSGGTAETMLVNESGLIIDCTSVDNIIATVNHLLSHPDTRAKLGLRGREHVVSSLDWQQCSKHLQALIQ